MGMWFNNVMEEFCPLAMRFAGQPILYLEIGVWKGNSAEWMLRNVLTHPLARGIGIDPYPADRKRGPRYIRRVIKAHALARLAPWTEAGTWSWRFEKSQDALRTWNAGQIDLLYLDGSHLSQDVCLDFCYAWPHLRDGSLVIFDDFGLGKKKERRGIRHVPSAVRAIIRGFGHMLTVENDGRWQYAVSVKNKVGLGEQRW